MDSPLACASAQVLCRSPRLAVVFQREFSSLVRSTNEYPSLIPSRELASHNEEEKKEREEGEKVTGPGCPPSLSSHRFCERRKIHLAIFDSSVFVFDEPSIFHFRVPSRQKVRDLVSTRLDPVFPLPFRSRNSRLWDFFEKCYRFPSPVCMSICKIGWGVKIKIVVD